MYDGGGADGAVGEEEGPRGREEGVGGGDGSVHRQVELHVRADVGEGGG